MAQFVIWWKPSKEQDFSTLFPELDIANSNQEEGIPEFPEGFKWVEQELSNEQFMIVDTLANNHVCIDVKPSPHPPYSPTGR